MCHSLSRGFQTTPLPYRDLKKLPIEVAATIIMDIGNLRADPRPAASKQLKGHPDLYRLRTGSYRMIYRIDDVKKLVEIARVGDRKEVYDDL